MSFHWELELYFLRDNRDPDADDELEATHYYGRPVYKRVVEPDSFEHGQSGTLAMYWKEELETGQELMSISESVKDPDLIAVEANRIGQPDLPDPEDVEPDRVDADVA